MNLLSARNGWVLASAPSKRYVQFGFIQHGHGTLEAEMLHGNEGKRGGRQEMGL